MAFIREEIMYGLYCAESEQWITTFSKHDDEDVMETLINYNLSSGIKYYSYKYAIVAFRHIVEFNKHFDDPFFEKHGVKAVLVPIFVRSMLGVDISVVPDFTDAISSVVE